MSGISLFFQKNKYIFKWQHLYYPTKKNFKYLIDFSKL